MAVLSAAALSAEALSAAALLAAALSAAALSAADTVNALRKSMQTMQQSEMTEELM